MEKQYNINDFQKFIIIGYKYNSTKKFRLVYTNWYTADCINLWKGKVWGILKDSGKRVLLKTVNN